MFDGSIWSAIKVFGLLESLDPLGDASQIAYYKFEGNFNDAHGNFNSTGTLGSGTPTFGNTARSQYWENPDDQHFNVGTIKNSYPYSIAAWVRIPSGIGWHAGDSNNRLIVNAGINGQRVSHSIVDWTANNTETWSIMYGGTNHWTFTTTSQPTDEWIHVVYSVVGSNNSSHAVYQNGVSCTASNRGGGHGGSAGWVIGGNTSSSGEDFFGEIYNIRVFNKALSQAEAEFLYNNDQVV